MIEDRVSIVLRTIGNHKKLLERAIFSIYCSSYPNKEIVFVYQGNDIEFLNYLEGFKNLYNDIAFIIIHNDETKVDQRAKNLNLGINKVSGRYLAFLDDDDAVGQEHYQDLIYKIKKENFVWGYANCCLNAYQDNYLCKKTYPYIKRYSFDALLMGNFIPIHSFVIDLKAISNKSIIKTDDSLTRLEDYYILLNLASRYMPAALENIGVFYNFYLKHNGFKDEIEFNKSIEVINKLKKEINSKNNERREVAKRKTKKVVKIKEMGKVKICYRILFLMCYEIPFIGKRIIRRQKAVKFAHNIFESLRKAK